MSPLPPHQRATSKFPRFGVGWGSGLPVLPEEPRLRLSGEVAEPSEITLEELGTLPRHTRTHDLHCVTTWTKPSLEWSGWLMKDVLHRLIEPRRRPGSSASYLVCFGHDRYRATLHLDDALKGDILIADRLDGEPLSTKHGAPLRLVCPAHYGYKSVKHLAGLALRDERPGGMRYGLEHPRGRVALEERHASLPSWLVRPLYRLLIGPTAYFQNRGLTSSDWAGRPTLLDGVMAEFDENEGHHLWVPSSPREAYAAILETTPREIRLLGPLILLRTLPALLMRHSKPIPSAATIIEGLIKSGFAKIDAEPDREIVFGVAGRFWKLLDNQPAPEIVDRQSFLAFDRPGNAKAAMSFLVRREGEGSRIITETRIRGTDESARRKFKRYWRLIRGGSGAIRLSWLAAIRRRLGAVSPRI